MQWFVPNGKCIEMLVRILPICLFVIFVSLNLSFVVRFVRMHLASLKKGLVVVPTRELVCSTLRGVIMSWMR